MNILMIHPHDLYSSSEPWTIRIKNLAYQFIKRGHCVKLVYFPLEHKRFLNKFFDNGVEIIPLDRRLGLFILLKNIKEVIKISEWADIIHFQKCHYYASLPPLIASWIKNKPIHYDWDDLETKIFYYSNPTQFIIGEFLNIFENLIPKVVDTVSVSSAHLLKLCLQRGVPAEDVFSAPVGANLEQFRPGLNSSKSIKKEYHIGNYLVLYVGQLHGAQYAELLIKAAVLVTKQRKDVAFMFVGDGYRLRELKELAVKEKIEQHVIFTGYVDHDEIPYYMADADVCVACFEDNDITRCKSPLKIAEYLASGKAIVASNVGDVCLMVGGVGLLVEPGNVKALAEGILWLLEDAGLREKLGRLARLRAEKSHRWAKTAENLLAAYKKAMG